MKLADDACARILFLETQERPKRRESLDFWEGVITLDLCHYHSYLSLYGRYIISIIPVEFRLPYTV